MSFLDDWKEWSTGKKALSIFAVCCIGLIIIAVLGGGLSSDKNTETGSTANTGQSNSTHTTGKQVKIIYDGQWQGAVVNGDTSNSISGSGEDTIDIDSDSHIISANAQKMDSSNGKLTIQILKDGKVVKESSTTAEYGVASVSSTG